MPRFLVLIVALSALGLPLEQASSGSTSSARVIRGATLIDGTGSQPIPNSVVVIDGTRITCAGMAASCDPLPDASVIDATGRWVTPGLIDTHVHLNWTDHRERTEQAQAARFALGITTVREVSTHGQLKHNLAARERAEDPSLSTPRLVVSARVSEENRRRYGIDDNVELVRHLAKVGVDAIKLKHPQIPEEELGPVISAAHAVGLPIFGHAWSTLWSHLRLAESTGSFATEAIRAGLDGMSHIRAIPRLSLSELIPRTEPLGLAKHLWLYTDPAKLSNVADEMVRHGVWLEPLLVVERYHRQTYPIPDDLYFLGRLKPLRQILFPTVGDNRVDALLAREAVARQQAFVQTLHDRGGMVITGTDGRNGVDLHVELRLLVESGLTPGEALRAATHDAAVALRREHEIGTIEPGKLADLVLFEVDPLAEPENLHRIWRVIKGGVAHDPRVILKPFIERYTAERRQVWARRIVKLVGILLVLAVVILAAAHLVTRWVRALPVVLLLAMLSAAGPTRAADVRPIAPGGRDLETYTFAVAGHAYGAHYGLNTGLYPKLLDALRTDRDQLDFVVLTGDIVRTSMEENWRQVLRELGDVGLPYYFVMGNHDNSRFAYDLFQREFGGSFYRFDVGTERFVVLDTQQANYSLTPEQHAFLRDALEESADIRNVFVFFHELLWLNYVKYKNIESNYGDSNVRYFKTDYWTDIHPLLRSHVGLNVYVIAGDVGGNPRAIPAFHDVWGNVTLVASGMGEVPDENYLLVRVDRSEVRLDVVPLPWEGRPAGDVRPVQWYSVENLERLAERPVEEPPLHVRLWRGMLRHRGLFGKAVRALTDHYFWTGFLGGILALFGWRWVERRFRRRPRGLG